jgi:enolase-phosphatase E1
VIKAVVTDIEGTTTSLSFVKDELFPYARARMAAFVRARADDPGVKEALEQARALMAEARGVSPDEMSLEEIIRQLERWIDEDRKITPLKQLQGLIWEQGYRDGELFGHLYPDAVSVLRSWHEQGIALYVYSSGSIHAQKLLFGHTTFGDLTPLFSGYFDTTTGPKQEAESYRRIVAAIGLPAEGDPVSVGYRGRTGRGRGSGHADTPAGARRGTGGGAGSSPGAGFFRPRVTGRP